MTEQESRQHPRFAVQIKAEVKTPAGDSMPAVTKDMSRGGICLVCPNRVGAGEVLQLSLSLVLGANTFSESLALPARVVWCTSLDDAFQVGAMFKPLDHEKRGFLEMFLRFLQQEVLVTREHATLDEDKAETKFDTGDADEA